APIPRSRSRPGRPPARPRGRRILSHAPRLNSELRHPASRRASRSRRTPTRPVTLPTSTTSSLLCSRRSGERSRDRRQLAAALGETGRAGEAETGGAEFERGAEYAEAVLHAAAEVDRRGLGKVPRRARDLADVKAEPDGLRQHLVVEDEVV